MSSLEFFKKATVEDFAFEPLNDDDIQIVEVVPLDDPPLQPLVTTPRPTTLSPEDQEQLFGLLAKLSYMAPHLPLTGKERTAIFTLMAGLERL